MAGSVHRRHHRACTRRSGSSRAPVGEPLTGHDGEVRGGGGGAPPDGTPVIISGSGLGPMRVWRMADGTPVGRPLFGHAGLNAVAAGALPDGTPVIISGGGLDGTVRVWRTADGTPVGGPLYLPESGRSVAVDGNIIVTAAGADIAVCQLALPQPIR